MRRSLGAFACAVVLCQAAATAGQAAPGELSRSPEMQFQLRLEGPATACADRCRTLVYASGMIKPDTASEFEAFAARNDVRNATIVLDSEGGSVLGALALGRAIRKLNMTTMVGRVIDLPAGKSRDTRASVSPRGDCESMCAFVLLAGVNRIVPAEARVRVHQIWLGDRREDAAAATYSAEDLVLVQRDIGRLAHYTVDMGGSVEMLELSLRIPPWEPMRLLTRDELRRMGFQCRRRVGPRGRDLFGVAVERRISLHGYRSAAQDFARQRARLVGDQGVRADGACAHPSADDRGRGSGNAGRAIRLRRDARRIPDALSREPPRGGRRGQPGRAEIGRHPDRSETGSAVGRELGAGRARRRARVRWPRACCRPRSSRPLPRAACAR